MLRPWTHWPESLPDLLAVPRRSELPADSRADDPSRRGGRGRPRALAPLGAADRRSRPRPRRLALHRRGALSRRPGSARGRGGAGGGRGAVRGHRADRSAASSTCRPTPTPTSSRRSASASSPAIQGLGPGPGSKPSSQSPPGSSLPRPPRRRLRCRSRTSSGGTVLNRKGGRFSLMTSMPFDPGLNWSRCCSASRPVFSSTCVRSTPSSLDPCSLGDPMFARPHVRSTPCSGLPG